MARPTLRPSRLLRTLVAIIASEPTITAKHALIRAGYALSTASTQSKAVLQSPTCQALLAEQRETYKNVLREHLPIARAAKELAKLALNGKNEFAQLQALDKGLQHLGIVEQADRKQVIVFAFQLCVNRFAPLVSQFVPIGDRSEFARKVSEVFELESTAQQSQEKQGIQGD